MSKLLDHARDVIRLQHKSYDTEICYISWIKRFILFHRKKHPKDMGEREVVAFLTHLAVQGKCAVSTQNQDFHVHLLLYKSVLKIGVGQHLNRPIVNSYIQHSG